MVVLDLYILLLSRTADGERGHVCLYRRAEVQISCQQQALSVLGIAGTAGSGGVCQLDRAKHREVAAERRRRFHLRAAADAAGDRDLPDAAPRQRDAFHVAIGVAGVAARPEQAEFLVEHCLRLYGDGDGVRHERGGARSAQDFPARHLRLDRADRGHVRHCDHRAAVHFAGGQRGRAQRRVPGHQRRIGAAGNRMVWHSCGHAGHGGQCRRRGRNGCGRGAHTVCGRDRPLPAVVLRKIHPRWKTPWISILIQAGISALILIISQLGTSVINAYQFLVSMSVILYFIPFLYMYAAAIKLAYRKDRRGNEQAVLVPGGKAGIWITGSIAFLITLGSMAVAGISPDSGENRWIYLLKVVFFTVLFIGTGLVLYWRGARRKAKAA